MKYLLCCPVSVPHTTGGLAPVGLVTVRKSVPVGQDPELAPEVGGEADTKLSKSNLKNEEKK